MYAEADARAALAAIQSPPTPYADIDKTTVTDTGASDKSGVKMVKKKSAKPKFTAKEKKERDVRLLIFKSLRSINLI